MAQTALRGVAHVAARKVETPFARSAISVTTRTKRQKEQRADATFRTVIRFRACSYRSKHETHSVCTANHTLAVP